MPENRMSSPLRGARPRLRRVGVLVAALALLSTPLASGVAAADSNRATALKGLLAEMPGTVDAASSGTLNLKRLLTYSRNAEQREFTRKVLTENGFDGAYIRFSSTDDVGYTQYAFSLRARAAGVDTQKRLSRFDPELSQYKPFLVGEVPGAFGYTYVETKPIDGGNPCNAEEIVFSAGRDYFEVGGCSDKSRGDTGDLRAFANAQYCLAAGASGGEHCLVDFDAETNGLASSALDLKQAASFVGNQRFLSTHGYLGGTYAAGTLTEGGVEILIALAFKTPGAASAFQQLVEKSAAQRSLRATAAAPRCADRRPRRRRYQHATTATGRDERAALRQPGVVVRSGIGLLLPDVVHDDTAARHGANRGAHPRAALLRDAEARRELRSGRLTRFSEAHRAPDARAHCGCLTGPRHQGGRAWPSCRRGR